MKNKKETAETAQVDTKLQRRIDNIKEKNNVKDVFCVGDYLFIREDYANEYAKKTNSPIKKF